MSAILVGITAVIIYAIGVFMGIWIGRSKPSQNTNNWRGAVPQSGEAPPKPTNPPKAR